MAGAYCRYCGHRCFVYRVIPAEPGVRSQWGGHLATCQRGMEHDRQATGGFDHTNTVNPMDQDGAA
jgi:hypothetical protein